MFLIILRFTIFFQQVMVGLVEWFVNVSIERLIGGNGVFALDLQLCLGQLVWLFKCSAVFDKRLDALLPEIVNGNHCNSPPTPPAQKKSI